MSANTSAGSEQDKLCDNINTLQLIGDCGNVDDLQNGPSSIIQQRPETDSSSSDSMQYSGYCLEATFEVTQDSESVVHMQTKASTSSQQMPEQDSSSDGYTEYSENVLKAMDQPSTSSEPDGRSFEEKLKFMTVLGLMPKQVAGKIQGPIRRSTKINYRRWRRSSRAQYHRIKKVDTKQVPYFDDFHRVKERTVKLLKEKDQKLGYLSSESHEETVEEMVCDDASDDSDESYIPSSSSSEKSSDEV